MIRYTQASFGLWLTDTRMHQNAVWSRFYRVNATVYPHDRSFALEIQFFLSFSFIFWASHPSVDIGKSICYEHCVGNFAFICSHTNNLCCVSLILASILHIQFNFGLTLKSLHTKNSYHRKRIRRRKREIEAVLHIVCTRFQKIDR